MKVIGKVLCGECPPKKRRVMARLVDTPDGPALRATYRRARIAGPDVRYDVTLERLAEQWSATPVAKLGCPLHSYLAVTVTWLEEIVAEYRQSGRPVIRVVDHPPQRRAAGGTV